MTPGNKQPVRSGAQRLKDPLADAERQEERAGAITDDAIVLGLTGAFGSGCTTLADGLADDLGFERIRVSGLIIEEWQRQQMEAGQGPLDTPTRTVLQDIGDEMRRERRSYWVERAIERVDAQKSPVDHVVIDGIRNPGEVEWLRARFKRFFLIGVDAHPSQRWTRLVVTSEWRDFTKADFDEISSRDAEAPEDYGQRVQQCMDLADFLIANDRDYQTARKARHALLAKAQDFLRLCSGPSRRPSDQEFFMHLAYGAASGSACLKRNVGAVIVRPGDEKHIALDRDPLTQVSKVVGLGFNENPDWMKPCYLHYEMCYRDIWRKATWEASGFSRCPHCGGNAAHLKWPYRCEGCKRSLLHSMFPERAMTRCTAIHAEVRAIQSAQTDLAGCHMYATTMPCFLCAEEILQAGISHVVYFEPYPDTDAEDLLRDHGVVIKRFEGVKSLAFTGFFGNWRAQAEAQFAMEA